jgi:hypothetical protein
MENSLLRGRNEDIKQFKFNHLWSRSSCRSESNCIRICLRQEICSQISDIDL